MKREGEGIVRRIRGKEEGFCRSEEEGLCVEEGGGSV